MPRFFFDGFTEGSAVALRVNQNGNEASGAVSAWGLGQAAISIAAKTQPVVTAPAGVWLSAEAPQGFDFDDPGITGYTPAHHELVYVWTVRKGDGAGGWIDKPLADYTAPVNVPDAWRDANTAYGPEVAVFLTEPGLWRVDLWCVKMEGTDAGTTATASWTVTVGTADSVYAGTRTICYSEDPAEDWAFEVPGCLRATSRSVVQTAINQAATPPRLLFKRGQDITALRDEGALLIDNGLLGHVGAWGDPAAAPPRVIVGQKEVLDFFNDAKMSQVTIADLDFVSGWDDRAQVGVVGSPFSFGTSPTSCVWTIWNCRLTGCGNLGLATKAGLASTVMMGNTVHTGWRDYGSVLGTVDQTVGIVGCDISRGVNAAHNGYKIGNMGNDHGPFRFSRPAKVYMGVTSTFSRCGWSGLSSELADQPCLRINVNGITGAVYNFDRISAEGGTTPITMTSINANPDVPGTYLFDKVLAICSAKSTSNFISGDHGGTTLRNVYGLLPNAPRKHPNRWDQSLGFTTSYPTDGNEDAPIRVTGMTFVSLLNAANSPDNYDDFPTLLKTDGFTTVTEENNAIYAEDMSPGATVADGPLDLAATIPGIQPRFTGVYYNYDLVQGTLSADVAEGQSFVVPYGLITEDTPIVSGTAATTQAYWQLHEATDTRHMLVLQKHWHAELGEFSVAFEAGGVRITNASGMTWAAGKSWHLRLDRSSRLPAVRGEFASPAFVPLPRPLANAGALDAGDQGLKAYDDFFGVVRPNADIDVDHRGDPVADSGNDAGAFLDS